MEITMSSHLPLSPAAVKNNAEKETIELAWEI
jgi:hypothetical protein